MVSKQTWPFFQSVFNHRAAVDVLRNKNQGQETAQCRTEAGTHWLNLENTRTRRAGWKTHLLKEKLFRSLRFHGQIVVVNKKVKKWLNENEMDVGVCGKVEWESKLGTARVHKNYKGEEEKVLLKGKNFVSDGHVCKGSRPVLPKLVHMWPKKLFTRLGKYMG